MGNKKPTCYSGIGGQAVLEGVMMKNGDKYAVAVRRPDGGMEIETDVFQGFFQGKAITKIPFLRGVFNFIDSLTLGMRTLNYSASFYDEEMDEKKEAPKAGTGLKPDAKEQFANGLTLFFSFALAICLFVVAPTYVASLFEGLHHSTSVTAMIEGGLRIVIFLAYLLLISLLKDIKRLYMYHGAEHKCINCIEKGKELTVENVMSSTRFHRRCGTSFLFFVVFISVVLFFFIRITNIWMRMGIRLLMVPLIAGISYEVLRLAGRFDNLFIRIISAPGILIQRITTKEPDESMVQVAIASVEAVFDWRAYLEENFGIKTAPGGEDAAADSTGADSDRSASAVAAGTIDEMSASDMVETEADETEADDTEMDDDDEIEELDREKLRAELLSKARENLNKSDRS